MGICNNASTTSSSSIPAHCPSALPRPRFPVSRRALPSDGATLCIALPPCCHLSRSISGTVLWSRTKIPTKCHIVTQT